MNLTMRQLGAALGVSVVIAIIGNSDDAMLDDFLMAWWIAAIALVLTAVVISVAYPSGSEAEGATPADQRTDAGDPR